MHSDAKITATDFQAIGEQFQAILAEADGRAVEDVALAYQEAAQRAGDLLMTAYECRRLREIPGLAKLIDKDAGGARLFRDFHGYEINAGVLLPQPPNHRGAPHAALTCGLLPRLLPDDPVFQNHRYHGKDPDRQAMLVNLRRAAAACQFLAAKVGDPSPVLP